MAGAAMTAGPSDDDKLDEALEETFPASDAPANTVETGILIGAPSPPSSDTASDNAERYRLPGDLTPRS